MCEFLQLGHRPGLVKRVRFSKTKPHVKHLYGDIMSFFLLRCRESSIWPKWSTISFSWRLTAWERSRIVSFSELRRSIISCLLVCLFSVISMNHYFLCIREHRRCHRLPGPWNICIQELASDLLYYWFQFFAPEDENAEGILLPLILHNFQL